MIVLFPVSELSVLCHGRDWFLSGALTDLLSQRWVLLSSSLKSYLPDQEVRDYHQSHEQLQEYAECLIPVLTNHLEMLIGVWFVGKIFFVFVTIKYLRQAKDGGFGTAEKEKQ